jgi:hypothetical protein
MFALSVIVAVAAVITGIVIVTYWFWRLSMRLFPPRADEARGRGFEVIVFAVKTK